MNAAPTISWILLALLLAGSAPAQEIVVRPDGSHPTLAEALRQVESGGRIRLQPGRYRTGRLVIDRPLHLVGDGEAILDGEGDHQILTITADSVTVQGLVFQNVATSFVEDRAAIKVEDGHDCQILDNRFEDTFFAIYLARSRGCHVARNEIVGKKASETQSGNGIHLWYSRNVTLADNHIQGHRDGIYLEFVEDSEIVGNVSERNLRYGLHFMFSDRCRYADNVLHQNDAGVAVMYSAHVEMTGNQFRHNWGTAAYGLLLKEITDSRIEANVFVQNTIGLYAEGVNRTTVARNRFAENGWAVKLMASSVGVAFLRNTFLANTFDVATNSRQHDGRFHENYWDRYEGYDLDRDGYGDVPHRPVRLFSLIVEHNEPAIVLMRSFLVDVLDATERLLPVLTPAALADPRPALHPYP